MPPKPRSPAEDTRSPSEYLKTLLPKVSNTTSRRPWTLVRWIPVLSGAHEPPRFTCVAPDITPLVVFDHKRPVNGGGSCDVYRGSHKTLGPVALKFVRFRHTPELMDHLVTKEINMWYNLRNPNIIPLLGVVWKGGDVYMVSKWVENGTLLEYVRSHPEVDKVELLRGVANGIAYLHERGVIHGDIKAANILVDENGVPMLTDFGLSKPDCTITSTFLVGAGSLRWTAPELLYEKSKGKASDVYAFAITIYEILSGRLPYADEELDTAIMRAILDGVRPPTEPTNSTDGYSYERLWKVATAGWATDSNARPTMQKILCWLYATPLISSTTIGSEPSMEFYHDLSLYLPTQGPPMSPHSLQSDARLSVISSIRFAPVSPTSDTLPWIPDSPEGETSRLLASESEIHDPSPETLITSALSDSEDAQRRKRMRREERCDTLLCAALSSMLPRRPTSNSSSIRICTDHREVLLEDPAYCITRMEELYGTSAIRPAVTQDNLATKRVRSSSLPVSTAPSWFGDSPAPPFSFNNSSFPTADIPRRQTEPSIPNLADVQAGLKCTKEGEAYVNHEISQDHCTCNLLLYPRLSEYLQRSNQQNDPLWKTMLTYSLTHADGFLQEYPLYSTLSRLILVWWS